MDVQFMNMMYKDYHDIHDKLRFLTQPVYIGNDDQHKEFDELVKDLAEYKTTLRYLQSMLVHEFHAIDSKFDPLVLCDDHEKWKAVITMLKHRADNSSTLSKRNRQMPKILIKNLDLNEYVRVDIYAPQLDINLKPLPKEFDLHHGYFLDPGEEKEFYIRSDSKIEINQPLLQEI